ncbi:unnamed protein product [Amoebophrya sp. A25]|nr:unnamed protein product [Amoebophrya sp. A25]|eukprot:GSA25T00007908001.1
MVQAKQPDLAYPGMRGPKRAPVEPLPAAAFGKNSQNLWAASKGVAKGKGKKEHPTGPYYPSPYAPLEQGDEEDGTERARQANRARAFGGLPTFYPHAHVGPYLPQGGYGTDDFYYSTANGRALTFGPTAMKCAVRGLPLVEDPVPSNYDPDLVTFEEEAAIPLQSLHLNANMPSLMGSSTRLLNPVVWRKVKRFAKAALGCKVHLEVPLSETRNAAALSLLHNEQAIALVKSKELSEDVLRFETYTDALTLLSINRVSMFLQDQKPEDVVKDLHTVPYEGSDLKNAMRDIVTVLGASSLFQKHTISPSFFGLQTHTLTSAIHTSEKILGAVVTMTDRLREFNSSHHKKLTETVKSGVPIVLVLAYAAGAFRKNFQDYSELKEEIAAVPLLEQHLAQTDQVRLISSVAGFLKSPGLAVTRDTLVDALLRMRSTLPRTNKDLDRESRGALKDSGATAPRTKSTRDRDNSKKTRRGKKPLKANAPPLPRSRHDREASPKREAEQKKFAPTQRHTDFVAKCRKVICQQTDLDDVDEKEICIPHLANLLQLKVEDSRGKMIRPICTYRNCALHRKTGQVAKTTGKTSGGSK